MSDNASSAILVWFSDLSQVQYMMPFVKTDLMMSLAIQEWASAHLIKAWDLPKQMEDWSQQLLTDFFFLCIAKLWSFMTTGKIFERL